MRRTVIIILLVTAIGGGFLFASPWWGGYRIAFDGYVVDSIAPTEYLSINLNLKPFPFGPSLQAGLAMSVGEHLLASFGSDIPLFKLHNHPFATLFRRSSVYAPTLGISAIFDLTAPQCISAAMTFQPLMFDFSDKQVGILGVHVLWDLDKETWGWGVRLFEISHYLW